MPSKTIPLKHPPILFENEGPIREIVLKEPTGGMYLDLGEPRLLARTGNGTVFYWEDKDAIKGYLDRCIDHPQGGRVLKVMSVSDIRAVREALFDFFIVSDLTTSDSSSTDSSSTQS